MMLIWCKCKLLTRIKEMRANFKHFYLTLLIFIDYTINTQTPVIVQYFEGLLTSLKLPSDGYLDASRLLCNRFYENTIFPAKTRNGGC